MQENAQGRSYARSPHQIARGQELRRGSTPAERAAWGLLRTFREDGYVFRRQHAVGKCIVDFCCPSLRLIVELDGSVHAQPSQAARDMSRDLALRRLGYTVMRIPNGMILSAPGSSCTV